MQLHQMEYNNKTRILQFVVVIINIFNGSRNSLGISNTNAENYI